MRRLALIIGLLAAMAAGVAASGSEATVPGNNGLIVFERLVGGHTQLFTVRPDGSGLRQITSFRFGASHAAWAPDGKSVVVEREGVAILDLRSGKLRQLGQRAAIFPAFSPDGKWIVYDHSTHEHNEGVWIMRANGRQHRYVPNADGCVGMAFSPDGDQFACIRKGALFVVNVDGSGRTPLVRPKDGASMKVDWSPDGSRILFHRNRKVFTIGADGTGLTQLTRGTKLCSESFSPDGTKILVLGNCESETDSYLLTMNVDGSGLTRIPNTRGAHFASWGRQP